MMDVEIMVDRLGVRELAIDRLDRIGLIDNCNVRDGMVPS